MTAVARTAMMPNQWVLAALTPPVKQTEFKAFHSFLACTCNSVIIFMPTAEES